MAKDFAKKFYRSKAWQRTREYCLMRDKYLCQHCGRPAEEVHHIVHLNPQNINDSAVSINPDNLVCLCRDCHFREHEKDRIKPKTDVAEGYEFDENGFVVKA